MMQDLACKLIHMHCRRMWWNAGIMLGGLRSSQSQCKEEGQEATGRQVRRGQRARVEANSVLEETGIGDHTHYADPSNCGQVGTLMRKV